MNILNMETQAQFLPESSLGGFKFKYVAEEELLRIVRRVRREKRKRQEALAWKSFLEDKESKDEPSALLEECQQEDTMKVHPLSNTPDDFIDCKLNSPKCDCEKKQDNPQIHLKSNVIDDQKTSPLPVKQVVHTDNGLFNRENRSLQRVAVLRYRIGLALDSILGMIQCQPPEPDGPDDLERRRTRTNEFLSRFSRNYLFQLRIQVGELRRQIVCFSLETPGRHTEHQALMQKFVSAHQTALQSLQAYLTQLPTSLHLRNIFGKLQDLLRYLCDLSLLKNQLESHAIVLDGFGDIQDKDEIYMKCRELMDLLEEKQAELENVSLSARASSPLSTRGSASLRAHQQPRMLQTQGNIKQGSWRRSAAHLARHKFGPPSSIRSSASPRLSSRGHLSNDDKNQRNIVRDCSDTELKELLLHMHEVLCNKVSVTSKKKKRRSKHHNSHHKCSDQLCKHLSREQKPYTHVQNVSSNVQLVITRHHDSDSEECQDVATDTADLNSGQQQELSKKTKKVGWAESGTTLNGREPFPIQDDVNQATGKDLPRRSLSMECRGRPPLSEQRIHSYRDRFQAYKTQFQNPTLQRWCDDILDSVFQDVAKELEPSFLLEKMYHLEFKD